MEEVGVERLAEKADAQRLEGKRRQILWEHYVKRAFEKCG